MERFLNKRRSTANHQTLPISSIQVNAGTNSGSQNTPPDGSGRAIRIDPPIVRNFKNASALTKFSYIWFLVSVCTVLWGWRMIRFHYASININCMGRKCTLNIDPPGFEKSIHVPFVREQIQSTEVTFVNEQGQERIHPPLPSEFNENTDPQGTENKKKTKKAQSSLAYLPDKDGYFESYVIYFSEEYEPTAGNHSESKNTTSPHSDPLEKPTKSFSSYASSLSKYVSSIDKGNGGNENMKNGTIRFIVRRFNLGHTRRRAQSQISKINTYRHGRRDTLRLDETTNISWQGILLMTLGSLSTLISIALGQFSEPDPYMRLNRGRRKVNQIHNNDQRKSSTNASLSSSVPKSNLTIASGTGIRQSSFAYNYTGYPTSAKQM